MEIHLKKNQAGEIMIPMVDSVTPAIFKSGLSVLDTAYYKDGAGAWTTLPIIGIFTEIATTGEYTIKLTAGELNHDLIMIKCTAAGAADSAIIIRTFAVDIDNLVRSTTPANSLDIEAGGTVGLDFANTNGTHPNKDLLNRIVGLLGHNMIVDDAVYSGTKMVSHTVYIYDTKANAQGHVFGGGGSAGLIYQYAGVATILSGNTALIEKVKEL